MWSSVKKLRKSKKIVLFFALWQKYVHDTHTVFERSSQAGSQGQDGFPFRTVSLDTSTPEINRGSI